MISRFSINCKIREVNVWCEFVSNLVTMMKCPHIEPDHLQKECLLAEFQETLEKRVLDGTV